MERLFRCTRNIYMSTGDIAFKEGVTYKGKKPEKRDGYPDPYISFHSERSRKHFVNMESDWAQDLKEIKKTLSYTRNET